MTDERRRYRRHPVSLASYAASAEGDLRIRDISLGGIGFFTHVALAIGEQYRINVRCDGQHFELLGKVIWSRRLRGLAPGLARERPEASQEAMPTLYRGGMEFKSTDHADTILSIVTARSLETVVAGDE